MLSHSKMVLNNAINRDATFLEKNEVMDYSLLVGLNSSGKTLVLGIIGNTGNAIGHNIKLNILCFFSLIQTISERIR